MASPVRSGSGRVSFRVSIDNSSCGVLVGWRWVFVAVAVAVAVVLFFDRAAVVSVRLDVFVYLVRRLVCDCVGCDWTLFGRALGFAVVVAQHQRSVTTLFVKLESLDD